MADTFYKLPLDTDADKDLLDWINSFPRNKKAEVVRHALRYYKSQLKEGETFIMPTGGSGSSEAEEVAPKRVKPRIRMEEKKPKANLLDGLKGLE